MKGDAAERACADQTNNDPDDDADGANGPLHISEAFPGDKFSGGIVCEGVASVNRSSPG